LLSASAPLRPCRRANTLAWPKYLPGKYLFGIVMCWNMYSSRSPVILFFHLYLHFFSPLRSLIYLRGVPGSTLGSHHPDIIRL
jgi:hypothetical protein